MATPKRTATGSWRVQIEARGVRDAATLATKREAVEWAAQRKVKHNCWLSKDLGRKMAKPWPMHCNATRLRFPQQNGGGILRWLRIQAFLRQADFPSQVLLSDLQPEHLAQWRDPRLGAVKAASVLRDLVLLSHVLEGGAS